MLRCRWKQSQGPAFIRTHCAFSTSPFIASTRWQSRLFLVPYQCFRIAISHHEATGCNGVRLKCICSLALVRLDHCLHLNNGSSPAINGVTRSSPRYCLDGVVTRTVERGAV